jgi:hypothetical protein
VGQEQTSRQVWCEKSEPVQLQIGLVLEEEKLSEPGQLRTGLLVEEEKLSELRPTSDRFGDGRGKAV